MKFVCDRVRDILIEEGNVEEVSSPITVCVCVVGLSGRCVVIFMVNSTICENYLR